MTEGRKLQECAALALQRRRTASKRCWRRETYLCGTSHSRYEQLGARSPFSPFSQHNCSMHNYQSSSSY